MKKLMTMLSAVGMALGLYAAAEAFETGTSFEGLATGAFNITEPGTVAGGGEIVDPSGGTFWATNGTETLTIKTDGVYDGDERPAKFSKITNEKYLEIQTALNSPVYRNVKLDGTARNMDEGVYFDSLVKFTAFEDEESVPSLVSGGKLAIWLKQNDPDNPSMTNLMITAGFLGSEVSASNYLCHVEGDSGDTKFNDGDWHRVTVKAIPSIYDSDYTATPGFTVYIDGDPVTSADPKGIDTAKLTPATTYLGDAIFPSAVQQGDAKSTIASVGFAGQGAVDDILFTSDEPFPGVTEFFTIEAGANVTSLEYTDGTTAGTGTVGAGGKAVIAYTDNMTVTITPTYSDGCVDGTWTPAAIVDGHVVSPTEAGQTVVVNGVRSRASVIYNNGASTNASATAAEAFEFIKDAGAGSYMVVLSDNSVGSTVLDTADRVVVLDLAGHSITGDTSSAAIAVSNGSLTIIDSVGDGEVTAGAGQNAVRQTGSTSTLVISNGVFNGVISVRTKGLYGGSYSYADNREETEEGSGVYVFASANRVADGYAATKTGDYWVVEEKPVVLSWETILGPAVGGAYEIDDLAELKAFQANVGPLETAGETFKLTDDIALDAAWPGIGLPNGKDDYTKEVFTNKAFRGTFDGQNHTISGFQMVGVEDNPKGGVEGLDYCGFFNSTLGATIENLKIQYAGSLFAVDTTASTKESGATFVGVAHASTLRNLTSLQKDASTGVSCSKGFGGIVGYTTGGTTVDSCTNNVNMTSLANNKCGGIAMITQGASGDTIIRNCQNNGTQTTSSGNSEYGAIVGYVGRDTTIENCETTVGRFLKHQTGTVTLQGVNKGDARVLAYDGIATPGLNFATVDGNVATFVADNPLALNGSYKVMATNAVPTFAFAEAGTISFDTNLTQNVTFNITASDNLDLTDATVAGVVTFTATDATPSEIDPEKDVLAVDIKATDATDATNKVEVAVPAGSGAVAAEYKALFKLTATEKSAGVYTVEITGIKDDVVADVSEDAVDALTDTTKTTIDIPAGLYYRISPGAALPITITTVSTRQGLSTGSVDKPTITGGDGSKGFYKVELSPKPFPALPPES